MINKLLIKDMTKRLGTKNDVDEVLAHPFFEDVNMRDLKDK